MKFFRSRIKTSDRLLIALFIGLMIIPIISKLLINGLLGPTFNFYFFILWIPFICIALAFFRGWPETALTAVFVVLAFSIALVTYPYDATMDFRRQIVNQADDLIVFISILSLISQIYLRKLRLGRSC